MTSRQKAEDVLYNLVRVGLLSHAKRVSVVQTALEAEYDEGFQNGMNRAQEDEEHEHRKQTGPVA